MTETIKEMAERLALERMVAYCAELLEKLEYGANDLSNAFGIIAEIQANQVKAYEKELEETPEVRKPEPKPKN